MELTVMLTVYRLVFKVRCGAAKFTRLWSVTFREDQILHVKLTAFRVRYDATKFARVLTSFQKKSNYFTCTC